MKKLPSIVSLVEKVFELSPGLLMSRSRTQHVADARQMSVLLYAEFNPDIAQSEIGRRFGLKPCTVIHSLKTIKDKMATEPALKRRYEAVKARLGK